MVGFVIGGKDVDDVVDDDVVLEVEELDVVDEDEVVDGCVVVVVELDDVLELDEVVVLLVVPESSTTFATATPPPAPASSRTKAIAHTAPGLMRSPWP